MRLSSIVAFSALSLACAHAAAVDLYGGAGTTGLEIGAAQPLNDTFGLRVDANSLHISRGFTTNDINYDTKVKFSNVGLYADAFVAGNFRITAGALVGTRKIDGHARSVGNTIEINGVTYLLGAGDTLDFEAKFPKVTPYLGVGWGHQGAVRGLHFYADAGVAFGRPEVKLQASASLAAKVNPNDLVSEQRSAQEKADDFRYYPVLKVGIGYVF